MREMAAPVESAETRRGAREGASGARCVRQHSRKPARTHEMTLAFHEKMLRLKIKLN